MASAAGATGPWYVLAAILLGLACRTLDIEGWGIPIRGGLVGRAGAAFGPRAAAVAAAAQLLERVLFASLMSVVFGRYIAALPIWLFVPPAMWSRYFGIGDLAVTAALGLLGFAWIRARLGYSTEVGRAVRRTWIAASVLLAIVVWRAHHRVWSIVLSSCRSRISTICGCARRASSAWLAIASTTVFTFGQCARRHRQRRQPRARRRRTGTAAHPRRAPDAGDPAAVRPGRVVRFSGPVRRRSCRRRTTACGPTFRCSASSSTCRARRRGRSSARWRLPASARCCSVRRCAPASRAASACWCSSRSRDASRAR